MLIFMTNVPTQSFYVRACFFALTMHTHKRRKECCIPAQLESIVKGEHKNHFGPKIPPQEHCLRLFDQVQFNAWIPQGTKILLNMLSLFNILTTLKGGGANSKEVLH